MPGFLTGLVNAGTAGLLGAMQGDDARKRAVLAEAARRAQAQRDKEEMDLKRLAALGTAASQGFDLTAGSRRSAVGAAPVTPEGGREAVSVTGPTVPGDAAEPVPATDGPPDATADGTPIGEVAGVRIAVPPGGMQSKTAREAQQKAGERQRQIDAYNAGQSDATRRVSPSLAKMLSGSETAFGAWLQRTAGLTAPARDPIADHRANRTYDIEHPLPERGGTDPNWQVVPTDQGFVQVNPKTGETRPVQGPGGGDQLQGKVPPAQAQGYRENRALARKIQNAIDLITASPTSVGMMRGISETADQTFDSEGVPARAALAAVGGQKFHDLSGAAVSASESARLRPYIPTVRDQSGAAVQKLTQMLAEVTGQQHDFEEAYPALAHAPANAPTAPRVTPTTTRAAGSPPARSIAPSGSSDADLWEKLVNGGMSPEQATRAVQNRKR